MLDLRPHRERMVQAILDCHIARSIAMFPEARANLERCRAENETYRPYAERDVDAIIEALASDKRQQDSTR